MDKNKSFGLKNTTLKNILLRDFLFQLRDQILKIGENCSKARLETGGLAVFG